MVLIPKPPPVRAPKPCYFKLQAGSQLFRIFNPTRHNTKALTFRHYGPINRFDHQRLSISGTIQKLESGKGHDPERGIYYAGFSLSCCLVEYFGDSGVIEITDEQICQVQVTRDMTLLDLRGSGSMRAGSVAALSKIADREISQQWSRYFYEQTHLYGDLDGILYFNAHNDEEAIALYERAQGSLICNQWVQLNHSALRPAIQP